MAERLALIIANSQFDDPKLTRLVAPSRDAEKLKRILENPDIGGFAVTMLVDTPSTDIRDAIVRLYERKTRNDLLLLYYSGHGIKDDFGTLYLAARDTQMEYFSARSIDAAFICDRRDKSNSQRKVIVLDCCHSGAFAGGAKSAVGSSAGTETAFGGSGYGWVTITASNAIEYAWEDLSKPVEARSSIFTQYLIQGLESGEADLNRNGKITLQELYDYTREQVLTSGRAKQTPLMWANQLEGQIIIAQNPRGASASTDLLAKLQQYSMDPQPWIRKGAVEGLAQLLRNPNEALVAAARKTLEQMLEDDSRSVSRAAADALGINIPPIITEGPQPRHPSLTGTLSPGQATVNVGQDVTWTLPLRNDGDDDLYAITVRRDQTLLKAPFNLAVGETKEITFVTHYATSGRKAENVVASTITGYGVTVEHTATARVTVRQPKPILHPSLKVTLSPESRTADVGAEIRWIVTLTNDGDDTLRRVTLCFGDVQKGEPFDLVPGMEKRFTLGRTYTTPGDKSERVLATGLASDASTVQRESSAFVTIRQPEKHPGVRVGLAPNLPEADVGQQITWTMSVHNNGDDDLQKVTIAFSGERKGEPFSLAAGKRRRFSFGRTYTTPGEKNEYVTAEATSSSGKPVRYTIQGTVTIRQPAKPPVTEPGLRVTIKAFAKTHDAEQMIVCPICSTDVKARNLVTHFDKVHAEDTSLDPATVRQRIATAASRQTTAQHPASTQKSLSESEFEEYLKPFLESPTSALTRTKPVDTTSRAHYKTLMNANAPETLLECPICRATLQAKNLLWHYDRRHTANAPEPTLKPAPTGKTPQAVVLKAREYNITKPIVLKLMRVPAEEFLMGSDPAKDKAAQPAEQPQHRVNLPDYYISESPITNAQYEVFVKATGHEAPEHWKRLLLKPKIPAGTTNSPVNGVSWHDAVAFCQWLSQETGMTFRLPTEAEWEKAARGTDGRIAVQQTQSTLRTVSWQTNWQLKQDSPYGCKDMLGKHTEWTQSLYWKYPYNATDGRENLLANGLRAVRGQPWFQATLFYKALRYAERQGSEPATRVPTFRVVMVSK